MSDPITITVWGTDGDITITLPDEIPEAPPEEDADIDEPASA